MKYYIPQLKKTGYSEYASRIDTHTGADGKLAILRFYDSRNFKSGVEDAAAEYRHALNYYAKL